MQVLSAMATTTTTTTITTTSVGARRRSLRVVASSSSGHADGGARPRCRHPKPPAFAAKRGVIIAIIIGGRSAHYYGMWRGERLLLIYNMTSFLQILGVNVDVRYYIIILWPSIII